MHPIRTCIACKTATHKQSLIRIVLKNGAPVWDFKKNLEGRGAYVCDNDKCVSRMADKKLLSRVFRQDIPQQEYQRLKEEYIALKG